MLQDNAMQSSKHIYIDGSMSWPSISGPVVQCREFQGNIKSELNLKSDILADAWSHRTVLHKIVAEDISLNLKIKDSEMVGQ